MKKLLEVVKNFDRAAFNAYMIANNIPLEQVLDLCIFAESERDSMRQELSSMLEVVCYDSECNYVEFAVVHTRENFYKGNDIEQLRLKAQIEQKERELAELKSKMNK